MNISFCTRALRRNYIGTEHLLLGLLGQDDSTAAKALRSTGISIMDLRAEIQGIAGIGTDIPDEYIPFTPRTKEVLELSLNETVAAGGDIAGTEHILLGIVREGGGAGAQVLLRLGVSFANIRESVIQNSGPPKKMSVIDSIIADLYLASESALTTDSELAARLRGLRRRLVAAREEELDFRTFPWESGGSATRARSARAGMAVAGGVVCAGVGVSR
jgi:ATP-dependent Clp protease ATP-binding subunit ClpA